MRILNIGPAFYPGMELDPGRYHVEVSAEGHESQDRWVTLSEGEDETLSMRLAAATQPVAEGKMRNNLGMAFVYIPPGSFMMGSPLDEADREKDETQHRVTLTKGYYLQTTEVTQGQWEKVMGNRPWSGKNYVKENANNPAVYVSWEDAAAFIKRLNQKERTQKYRLPTEAEWEYACRAGSSMRFCFGDGDGKLGDYAWYDKNADSVGEDYAHGVGTKQPNNWGLYDMHGNVWEWCADWYGKNYYSSSPEKNPQGPSKGGYRVLRGGAWIYGPWYVCCGDRVWSTPDGRSSSFGFRLVALPSQSLSMLEFRWSMDHGTVLW